MQELPAQGVPPDAIPNNADNYVIEQSPDGVNNWAQVATAAAGASFYAVGGLTQSTPVKTLVGEPAVPSADHL